MEFNSGGGGWGRKQIGRLQALAFPLAKRSGKRKEKESGLQKGKGKQLSWNKGTTHETITRNRG